MVKTPSNGTTIRLAGGTYRLEETFILTAADSGEKGAPVVYEPAAGATVRMSGGLIVKGWTRRADGVWSAKIQPGLTVRQLYVDEARATRARLPNEGVYVRGVNWRERDFTVALSAPPPLPSMLAGDQVEWVVNRHWQQHRLRVRGAERLANGAVRLTFPATDAFNSFNAGGGTIDASSVYFFENDPSFLDAPSEWYYDKTTGELLYKTLPGQSVREAVVPTLETLWRLQGTAGQPVHDIVVRGIVFEHASWNQPSNEGFGQVQGVWITSADGKRYLPAAVEVRGSGANNIRFEGNTFRHLGSTGLAFYKETRDNQVVRNSFSDISAGALAVDAEPDPFDLLGAGSRNFDVSDNLISRVGQDYTGAVGMFFGYLADSRIEHNDLADLPYSAISVGWGWTDKDNGSKNNVIRANRIRRAMLVHDDGGAIYTLSKQPGTIIAENYISEIRRAPYAGRYSVSGVYLDNGSEGITVKDNVIVGLEEPLHQNLTLPGPPIAKNNVFLRNEGQSRETIAASGPRR